MRIIEPCCATKQFMLLRDAIGKNGKTQFQGFGDLSLTELLPALLTRYTETEMMIVAPVIPNQAADIIGQWLSKTWARMDGKGRLYCIRKLTIIGNLNADVSPKASEWLGNNPFGARLVLVNREQDDTAIILPDIAITGPLNLRYGNSFVCNVTTIADEVSALSKQYAKLMRSAKHTTRNMAKKAKATAKPDDAPATDGAEVDNDVTAAKQSEDGV